MGFKDYLITFTIISMFVLLLLSFATQFAIQNSADISIADSDFAGGLDEQLITNADTGFVLANASAASFEESSIAETSESGTLVTGSQFKDAWKIPTTSLFNILDTSFETLGGAEDSVLPSIILMLTSLITIIGVLLIWKTWKGGNPE